MEASDVAKVDGEIATRCWGTMGGRRRFDVRWCCRLSHGFVFGRLLVMEEGGNPIHQKVVVRGYSVKSPQDRRWRCLGSTPRIIQLGSPPVTNWQNKIIEIIHHIMWQPPDALPSGSGHCLHGGQSAEAVSLLYPFHCIGQRGTTDGAD